MWWQGRRTRRHLVPWLWRHRRGHLARRRPRPTHGVPILRGVGRQTPDRHLFSLRRHRSSRHDVGPPSRCRTGTQVPGQSRPSHRHFDCPSRSQGSQSSRNACSQFSMRREPALLPALLPGAPHRLAPSDFNPSRPRWRVRFRHGVDFTIARAMWLPARGRDLKLDCRSRPNLGNLRGGSHERATRRDRHSHVH